MVRALAIASASAAVLASASSAFTVTITNGCSSEIDLYTRLASVYTDASETIAAGASVDKTIDKGYEGHFRNGSDDAATLVEFATKGDLNLAWYDIGIIPPRLDSGYEYCTSLQECKDHSQSRKGFNTPVQVLPKSNTNGANCREITCAADGCADAYNYPQDDSKTHSCTFGTDFVVTFCPSGDGSTTQQQTQAPAATTTAPANSEAPAVTTATPSAGSDNGAGTVHTQNSTPAPAVTPAATTTAPAATPAVTPAATTTAPAATPAVTPAATTTAPAATPAATKSSYCV